MRPGQNKRMRGRNNRRGPNPLTRTYESNGPDVKVRGTAQHVAEKYLQLARDAQSSGDPVMAESYLQHAEHYFRLIAAAQLALQQQQQGYNRPGNENNDADDMDDDDDGGLPDRFSSPFERQNAPGMHQQPPMPPVAQPPFDDQPPAAAPPAPERPPQGERPPRPERNFGDQQQRNRPNREDRPPRQFNIEPRPQPAFRPAPVDLGGAEQPEAALPAFITGGRPLAPAPGATAVEGAPDDPDRSQSGGQFHLRNRRRRRPREDGEVAAPTFASDTAATD